MCSHVTRRNFLTFAGLTLSFPSSVIRAQGQRGAPAVRGALAPDAARAMATAANAFLAQLRPEFRQPLIFSMDNPERKDWSNLPPAAYPRKGLRLGLLNDEELRAAHVLLQSILSTQGYLKAVSVMLHDDVFNENSMKGLAVPGGGRAAFPRGGPGPGGPDSGPGAGPGRPGAAGRGVGGPPAGAIGNFTPEERAAARGLGANGGSFGTQVNFLDIFGKPGGKEPWGVQLDGHHLAVNVTVDGDRVTISPTFLGSEPALIPSGLHAGWQLFGAEGRLGLELRNSLTAQQARTAVLSEDIPPDLFTGPVRQIQLKTPEGLGGLIGHQRTLLERLIDEYVGNAPSEVAEGYRRAIRNAGFDKVHFAWMGPTDASRTVYYRIHGPAILIEYENLPAGQTGGPATNHVHSILHVPGNDYGEDWLRQHHLAHNHSGSDVSHA